MNTPTTALSDERPNNERFEDERSNDEYYINEWTNDESPTMSLRALGSSYGAHNCRLRH
jgi:hypothetical protein